MRNKIIFFLIIVLFFCFFSNTINASPVFYPGVYYLGSCSKVTNLDDFLKYDFIQFSDSYHEICTLRASINKYNDKLNCFYPSFAIKKEKTDEFIEKFEENKNKLNEIYQDARYIRNSEERRNNITQEKEIQNVFETCDYLSLLKKEYSNYIKEIETINEIKRINTESNVFDPRKKIIYKHTLTEEDDLFKRKIKVQYQFFTQYYILFFLFLISLVIVIVIIINKNKGVFK
jgi:hypothetical protein